MTTTKKNLLQLSIMYVVLLETRSSHWAYLNSSDPNPIDCFYYQNYLDFLLLVFYQNTIQMIWRRESNFRQEKCQLFTWKWRHFDTDLQSNYFGSKHHMAQGQDTLQNREKVYERGKKEFVNIFRFTELLKISNKEVVSSIHVRGHFHKSDFKELLRWI